MPSVAVKSRPILFSSPVIPALIENRKSQTRRTLREQPPPGFDRHCWFDAPVYGFTDEPEPAANWWTIRCPYGQPGDQLWVKETFRPSSLETEHGLSRAIEYRADGAKLRRPREDVASLRSGGDWRSSRFMPRWASRITLEVTEVRVERLAGITHEDAIAEGCRGSNWVASSPYIVGPHTDDGELPVEEFERLWNEINGEREGCRWQDDPWVWRIVFRRIEGGGLIRCG